MRAIHKRSDGAFLFAVAAALFLASCAWGGAGLYARLRPAAEEAAAESAPNFPLLRGIALRREEALRLPASAVLLAQSGERLAAGQALACLADGSLLTAACSCLYFSDSDGWEDLSPPDPAELSVPGVRALLDSPASARGQGRLVREENWYFAALADASAPLPAPGPCRLRFAPERAWLSAQLLAVSEESGGERAALFRLGQGGRWLSLRRCEAALYFPGAVAA